jgi:hypothetical protein
MTSVSVVTKDKAMSVYSSVYASIADPGHFDTDPNPDPADHFDTDPDPTFHFDPERFKEVMYLKRNFLNFLN